jgi:hypothetical protein
VKRESKRRKRAKLPKEILNRQGYAQRRTRPVEEDGAMDARTVSETEHTFHVCTKKKKKAPWILKTGEYGSCTYLYTQPYTVYLYTNTITHGIEPWLIVYRIVYYTYTQMHYVCVYLFPNAGTRRHGTLDEDVKVVENKDIVDFVSLHY